MTADPSTMVNESIAGARVASKLAWQAYRTRVPIADGMTDVPDRLGAVACGRPLAPLEDAVATLSVASSAGARALALATARVDSARASAVACALAETVRSTQLSILSLGAKRNIETRMQLSHSGGYACHLITEAMVTVDGPPIVGRRDMVGKATGVAFPRAWRTLIGNLGTWVALHPSGTFSESARMAVLAAHAGAEHIDRAYEGFTPAGGADGALCRFARIAALAAVLAGWSVVDLAESYPTERS